MQTVAPYTTIITLNISATASPTVRDSLISSTKGLFLTPQGGNAPTLPSTDLINHTIHINNHDIYSAGFIFAEDRPVKWSISNTPIIDKINILCIISVYKSYACIHISDGESKGVLEREIKRHPQNFPALAASPHVNPKILETAFLLGAQFKALWLAGGHKATAVKASAKQLNGEDLEYALDPLGDQTFITRAARAQSINSVSYGVTPGRSAIWRGPNENFGSYSQDIALIIDRLEAAAILNANTPFKPALPMLMNTCESWTGVHTAYDFSLSDEDSLARKNKKIAQQLKLRFDINFLTSSTTDPTLVLEASLRGIPSQSIPINVTPTLSMDLSSVNFTATTNSQDERFTPLLDALNDSPEIWKCWYETYHTITAGKLCSIQRRHAPYQDWTWYDFGAPYAFNIEKEKPNSFSEIWTTPSEDSLFTWCVKSASGQLATTSNSNAFGLPDIPCLQSGADTWLYCDDNSGEIADFVYFHKDRHKTILGLIHAKGANSSARGRRAVPTPFEVVTAQATKNLVDFGNENLLSRIKSRVQASGAQKIWNSPWTMNPPTGTPAGFLNAINSNTASTQLFVMIVQPHVSRTNYYVNGTTTEKPGVAQEQLRTLLHAVKAASSNVSANFHVVADAR
jgi:hypothetical protein